jgi:hypothetical protein
MNSLELRTRSHNHEVERMLKQWWSRSDALRARSLRPFAVRRLTSMDFLRRDSGTSNCSDDRPRDIYMRLFLNTAPKPFARPISTHTVPKNIIGSVDGSGIDDSGCV